MSVFPESSSTRPQLFFFAVTRMAAVAIALAVFYLQLITVNYPMRWLTRPFGITLSALALSYLVTLVPVPSASSRRRWYIVWALTLAVLGAWVLGAVFAASVMTALPGAYVILSDCPELTGALVVTFLGALGFGFLATRRPTRTSSRTEE